MKRRALLASTALLPLAGCSDSIASPTTSSTTDTREADRHSTDDLPPISPAGQQLANAQTALDDAVDVIRSQITYFSSFTSFNAMDSLDVTPIEAALADAREATEAAQAYNLSIGQSLTLEAIILAEWFVRELVDIQPALHDLYEDVDNRIENAMAGEWNRVTADIVDVREAYDDVSPQSVVTAYRHAEGNMDLVDAFSNDALTAQYERVTGEYATIGEVLDGIETLETAEKTFERARDERRQEKYREAHDLFDEAETGYEELASDLTSPTVENGFKFHIYWLQCYGTRMAQACAYLQTVVDRHLNGGDWRKVEEKAGTALDEVEKCGLYM